MLHDMKNFTATWLLFLQKLLDKLFKPLPTTKPTGQGTGLGLSLSNDIVKAHGGEMRVETEEREY
jgi:two-component system NtrC family sensor kinase